MSRTTSTAMNCRGRRGFSIVEMLVALSISAMLLTAMLTALDTAWKSYKMTTESASTHIVSRIVVHRVLAMVRTGTEFGPYPADFLDPAQNPITSTFMEFVSEEDRLAGHDYVTRIERRDAATAGEYELWYQRVDLSQNPPQVLIERPLLRNVKEATFILEYEPGPRLLRATMDLTVQPNDDEEMRTGISNFETPVIRLVASASPRQLD
jgi:prepilin-type N-terminal cleavage/methylation domain-containing protein